MESHRIHFEISDSIGSVSATIMTTEAMRCMYIFAHGAGAGMDHAFMNKLAHALAIHHVGTFRFNFPYMQKGSKRPDVPAVAEKSVRSAAACAKKLFPDTPIIAGGKSFGGRMSSQWLAKESPPYVKGIVFIGFPLHPAGTPNMARAAHLADVKVPLLFLQGTRDALAQWDLITSVTGKLSQATLVSFAGADHSFKAGKNDNIQPLADAFDQWLRQKLAI